MKQHILSILLLAGIFLAGVFASCSDDLTEKQSVITSVDDTNLVETQLSLNVAAMTANAVTSTTRVGEDKKDERSTMTDEEKQGTDAERRIDNIWVFQFDATSEKLLITPRYYDISDQNVSPDEEHGKVLDKTVLLKPGVESIVYVVANTGVSNWATVANSYTFEDVKLLSLPLPNYIPVNAGGDLAIEGRRIPMEGESAKVKLQKGDIVGVKVTRMFAKVEINIGYVPETLDITDVQVGNIPNYCRVSSLDLDDENDDQWADYPDDTEWVEYAFKPGEKNNAGKYEGTMVIYIPENLQGRNRFAIPDDAGHKTSQGRKDALYLNFIADYKNLFTGNVEDAGRSYVFYPGANNYSDYNIKRNNIYRVTLDIYTDKYEQDTPSSNCFVVKPGQLLSFLPYYRTEEGGDFHFTDYLDANGDNHKKINDSDQMLENIKIIWQTKDAIGDNSNGDLVWIDRRSEVSAKGENPAEFYRKIHVRAGKKGNALIGAYDDKGNIVWSWHIWVTENEPANLSSAVVYSTYAWNENGIIADIRVPGYAIMPCNLGALAYEPEGGEAANNSGQYLLEVAPETHGMLYQWGRKDPFPPVIRTPKVWKEDKNAYVYDNNSLDYIDEYIGLHYANDNETNVGKTAGTDATMLFHSATHSMVQNQSEIAYSIKNPTVFLCGTNEANRNEDYVSGRANYSLNGDWANIHHETLWGGLDPMDDGSMKYLDLGISDGAGNKVHIFDNYGDKKSIFDPCPSGWRVPPGDLWLGFTSTGKNPKGGEYRIINTSTPEGISDAGMYMHMNGWIEGTTIFFPTQGTRVADGRIIRFADCGNYHNATTDKNQRVNILHIHNSAGLFRVFETTYYMYYVKSVGGPIRCVRDHK